MKPSKFRLEESPIWQEVNAIAEHIYPKAVEFPEEEKWSAASKLRSLVVDSLFWTALAIGNPGPAGVEYDWAAARKSVAALKTLYRFAGRQKFIDLDPAVMVRLEGLLREIEAQRQLAKEQQEKHLKMEREKELKPWLEKYNIWKKLNSGDKT